MHQRTYAYDALGRRIVSKEFRWPTDDPATATPVRVTHSYHDEGVERDGTGTVHTQYVWSADGDRKSVV